MRRRPAFGGPRTHGLWILLGWVFVVIGVTGAASALSAPKACGFTVDVTASPSTGPAPLLVRFNATVSSGAPSAYSWDFGDGSFWNGSVSGASSPLHRYNNPGSYPVLVRVTEPACSADGTSMVAASPGALSIAISTTPASGSTPLTVEFSANVTGGTGTYVAALWTFGDGSVGSGIPVVYTYQKPGTFHYSVNVTDSSGHWAMASGTEVVRADTSDGPGELLGLTPTPGWIVGVAAGLALTATLSFFLVGRVLARRGLGPPTARSPAELPRDPDDVSGGSIGPPTGGKSSARDTLPASPVPELAELPRAESPPSDRARSAPPAPPRSRVQLTQRVVLHIGAQGRLGRDEIGPLALTQSGMASTLGVGQSTLTNVLRRLVAAGVLTQDVRHVSGQSRRLRVYSFTPRGESVYRDVRLARPSTDGGDGEDGTAPDWAPRG
ncbi:MAG: PKD domain-containing protein [Thermoplasmata archaeon]|nr:PKD domain-containing protein [Thermoplasmata archaeon]